MNRQEDNNYVVELHPVDFHILYELVEWAQAGGILELDGLTAALIVADEQHICIDDCQAICTPSDHDSTHKFPDASMYLDCVRYCGCGHIDLDHNSPEEGYSPCGLCDCEDFSLVEEDGLTKGDDASTHPTQGMQDAMVVRGSQLVAREYAQVTWICLCCLESRCAACWPEYDHTQEAAHTPDS